MFTALVQTFINVDSLSGHKISCNYARELELHSISLWKLNLEKLFFVGRLHIWSNCVQRVWIWSSTMEKKTIYIGCFEKSRMSHRKLNHTSQMNRKYCQLIVTMRTMTFFSYFLWAENLFHIWHIMILIFGIYFANQYSLRLLK